MAKIYPIGTQTFSTVIENAFRYVDKTGYVYRLAQEYRFVFLSRPRRFGKSLLTSTFHSYFEGRKELFDRLEAGRLEKEWTKYPVLHFDMSTAKHQNREELISELEGKLADYEEIYGRKASDKTINQRMEGLIQHAHEQTGQKVVVLIDEYDAPLLDVLTDKESLDANRQVMRNFYSPLKACDSDLRFVFITGITKFSQLSIFSELNNLQNISMMPEYAGVCGITSEELQTQFSDDVDDFAEKTKTCREEALARLKEFYDGYHFTKESPDIYNPFSLIKALNNGDLDAFWFSSGTPTFLIEQMREFNVSPTEIAELDAMAEEFDAPTEDMTSITPLLYQSGYLTIKGYDPESMTYTLGIPNREVRSGLMKSLIPYVTESAPTPFYRLIGRMQKAFNRDDMDEVIEGLKVFFSAIPQTDNIKKNYEGYYQSILFLAFSMMCQYVDVEVRTPQGRADLVMNAKNKIYIIEVKIDKSADFALDQINLKNYGERFLIQGKPIVKIGINFDSEGSRNIASWKIID